MSGALETAASSFAVLGAADILIRTGREVYSFLSDFADAPREIEHLRQEVKEIAPLLQAAKDCLRDLDAHDAAAARNIDSSLSSATKALNRELQDLKLLIGKFKGIRTWSRLKYVFDEKKIAKTSQKLEHAKSLFNSASVLATSQLNSVGQSAIKVAIQKGAEQARNRDNMLSAKLDSTRAAITSDSDKRHHDLMDVQAGHHQSVMAALSMHHKAESVRHDASQKKATYQSKRTSKQLKQISRQTAITKKHIHHSNQASTARHDQTQGMISTLVARVEQLNTSVDRGNSRRRRGERDIKFFGERPDMIMAYLLSLQDGLAEALECLKRSHDESISKGDLQWLESEFRHLVDSAAQEQAARHEFSTAESFDAWTYSSGATCLQTTNLKAKNDTRRLLNDHHDDKDPQTTGVQKSHWRRRSPLKRIKVDTDFGEFKILLPRSTVVENEDVSSYETGFTCTVTHNKSIFVINARFSRHLTLAARPRLYTQLHALAFVSSDVRKRYLDLFDTGSLQEIDEALRRGIISLYHSDETNENLFAWLIGAFCRADIFAYYDSQGSLPDNSNGNLSFLRGYESSLTYPARTYIARETFSKPALKRMLEGSEDADGNFIQYLSLVFIDADSTATQQLVELLTLYTEWLVEERLWITRDLSKIIHAMYCDECCNYHISVDPIWFSVVTAVGLELFRGRNENYLQFIIYWFSFSAYSIFPEREICQTRNQKMIGLVSASMTPQADFHASYEDGATVSMVARANDDVWKIWCEALRRNHMSIEEIVAEEGNDWLLQEDWPRVWEHDYPESFSRALRWKRRDVYSGVSKEDEESSNDESDESNTDADDWEYDSSSEQGSKEEDYIEEHEESDGEALTVPSKEAKTISEESNNSVMNKFRLGNKNWVDNPFTPQGLSLASISPSRQIRRGSI